MTEDELYEKAERIKSDLEGLNGLGIKCQIVDARGDDNYVDDFFVAIEEIACYPEDECWIGYNDLSGWYVDGLNPGASVILYSLDEDDFRRMLLTIDRHIDEPMDIEFLLQERRDEIEEMDRRAKQEAQLWNTR